jgi:hypothetical protein
VQSKSDAWFRNLSSVSENVTSKLAETHTEAVRQHSCSSVQSVAAEELVQGRVATVLLLIPEKRRYRKYGGFTLMRATNKEMYTTRLGRKAWLNIGMILTVAHMRLGTGLSAAKPKLPA